MVRWYVSFRRPRFLIPGGLQYLFGLSACSACLGVLSVWVFCLFGCSICLGVLPVWVFCLFGCSAVWVLCIVFDKVNL